MPDSWAKWSSQHCPAPAEQFAAPALQSLWAFEWLREVPVWWRKTGQITGALNPVWDPDHEKVTRLSLASVGRLLRCCSVYCRHGPLTATSNRQQRICWAYSIHDVAIPYPQLWWKIWVFLEAWNTSNINPLFLWLHISPLCFFSSQMKGSTCLPPGIMVPFCCHWVTILSVSIVEGWRLFPTRRRCHRAQENPKGIAKGQQIFRRGNLRGKGTPRSQKANEDWSALLLIDTVKSPPTHDSLKN